jgi:LysM repeat protein
MAIFETYTVKAGDTLGAIAKRFGSTIDTLTAWNQLKDKNTIAPNQVLKVRQINEIYYIIQPGDTLAKIAKRYNVSLDDLQKINGIGNASKIAAGARLVIPTAAPGATATTASPARELGSLSSRYEVSKDGAATVSIGKGDHGGVSYGSYQLSSNMNRPAEFLIAEGKPWENDFAGLVQGTPPFSAMWEKVAALDPVRFAKAQHLYIERTHYEVQAKQISKLSGLDIKTCSRALQDVAWSVAVQHGPLSKLFANVVNALPQKPDDPLFEKSLITAIYGERGRRDPDGKLHYFRKSDDNFQDGVAKRFVRELKDALDMLSAERVLATITPSSAAMPSAAMVPQTDIAPPILDPLAPASAADDVVRRAAAKLTDDDIRLIVEKYGDAEAVADFLVSNKVLIGLRKSTNVRTYQKGVYDDLLLVVDRQANGSVKLRRFPLNTEPAGEYAFYGTNKKKYGPDLNGDGKRELGRLVPGTYHYSLESGTFLGGVYFRARNVQTADRDINQDGNFDFEDGPLRVDTTTAKRSMLFHRGGAVGVATWSSGCQTLPKNHYATFLSALEGQKQFSYILINAD